MDADPTTVALADAFIAVAKRLRAASRASLAEWEVTPSQMRAVRALATRPGLRPSELALRLRIAPRSATTVVDSLEAKGLVQRHPDVADRRAIRIHLTGKGEKMSDEVRRAGGVESGKILEMLSKSDRQHLARILGRLADD